VATIALLACRPLTVLAQSSGIMGSSSTNTGSAQRLNTAVAALQQLLQSGNLTADQTQRATALLTAVESAIAGGTLDSTQLRQIGQAIAAARKSRQSSSSTAAPLLGQTSDFIGGVGIGNTQQLTTACDAIQELLQSGILTPAQTQRATALLAAVQNAIAGGALNSTQLRQIGQAIAAARSARQSSNSTSAPIAAARTSGLAESLRSRSNASASGAARQTSALSARSAMTARLRTR